MKTPGLDNSHRRKLRQTKKAFTLVDLLAVIAVMAVLAFMMLPALARIKAKSGGVGCMNNLRQLTLAAQVFSSDNRNSIPPNSPVTAYSWVTGNVNSLPGVTNIGDIRASLLYPYNQSVGIYRCPEDKDIYSAVGMRVRDYSLNGMMGDNGGSSGVHPGITENLRFTDIRNPGPSMASFFFEEQGSISMYSTSIDDGYFCVESGGTGCFFSWMSQGWRNVPSSRHGNYTQLSFADGHVDKLRWLHPSTKRLQGVNAQSGVLNNPDKRQLWLTTYAPGSVSGVGW